MIITICVSTLIGLVLGIVLHKLSKQCSFCRKAPLICLDCHISQGDESSKRAYAAGKAEGAKKRLF